MMFKILQNNIANNYYNKKIIKKNWIDKERMDAIFFDKESGSSFLNYVQKLTDSDWSEHSTKIIIEKSYGLYGVDDIDMAREQYEGVDHDSSRLDRILNLQNTRWYVPLQNLINSAGNLELIDIYNTNNITLDKSKITNIQVQELFLFRHYYQDNIILHQSSKQMIENKNWILLFFVDVDDSKKDKVVFIDSQETILLESNQVIMFPSHLANDFMIIKKNQEEDPLYYIQANLTLE